MGFWGCPGRKSWLVVWVRLPAGAAARLGFSQCGAHSLAAGVGAARLLEPEKLRGCCTGVCWAEACCQPAPHGSGALQWGCLTWHLLAHSPWVPRAPLGPGGGQCLYPCHLLPSLPHLRAPPAAPVHTPASRLTGDPRTRPQAPPVPTSPPGEPVGSLWPTCERVPSSVHPPRAWVLVWGRRRALLGVQEQSPSRDSTFSLADPACPPAPGAALAGDPEAWMVVPASGRGPRGPTAECSGLHPSWRTGVSGQAALGVGRAPFPLGLWGHSLLQRRPRQPGGLEPWADWCCDLVLAPPLLSRGGLSTGGLRGRGARTTIPAPRGTLHSPTEDRGPDGGAAGPSEAPSADPTLGVLPPCVPL